MYHGNVRCGLADSLDDGEFRTTFLDGGRPGTIGSNCKVGYREGDRLSSLL
jgi:hypothetical protein